MQTEIEAKWLNIDLHTFRQLLEELGAKLVSSERLMVRQVLIIPISA